MSICRFWTLSLSLNFSLCPHRVAFFLIYEPNNINGLSLPHCSVNWYLLRFEWLRDNRKEMADWGPVVIAVVLFVLLTPGLLFQLPGNSRAVEFANMQTSGVSILVHTIIYFGLITIFLIAIGVHITTG
ncbi:uncharacterized protein LOC121251214 [Juglans microcarpa x Juglans regia]|nr:uncharacterized protein LOC121251214 [Juglans microcarpa x Juglans regia]